MIRCCYGCVAPKRHAKCHGSCPEYAAELRKDADGVEIDRIKRGKKALQRARTGRRYG